MPHRLFTLPVTELRANIPNPITVHSAPHRASHVEKMVVSISTLLMRNACFRERPKSCGGAFCRLPIRCHLSAERQHPTGRTSE